MNKLRLEIQINPRHCIKSLFMSIISILVSTRRLFFNNKLTNIINYVRKEIFKNISHFDYREEIVV